MGYRADMSTEESFFRQRVESSLKNLLRQIDGFQADEELDSKITEGVLQVDFEKGGTFVLSQQVPVRELWLSAHRRAWHFRLGEKGWVERDNGQELTSVLGEIFSKDLGRTVTFKNPVVS